MYSVSDGGDDTIYVLHVDDEPGLAELTATFLEREDDRLCIETATDASEGLELLAETEFDCIISDYDMPGQNGIEFLGAVREEYADLPFILYTGKGSEEVASDAISAGVTDYLQKETGTDQYTILANRVRNLVERYHIEREVEQTRTQLLAISNNSADAIVLVDTENRIRFTNPTVEDHFGYTQSELQGEKITTIIPERYREDHLVGFDRYLQTGDRSLNWSNLEFPGRRKDGSEIPLSISFSEFKYDDERLFIGILRDISERIQMELEVAEREDRFQQVAENIEEVVWMSDPNKDELIYVNAAYEDVWGRSVESLYDDPKSFVDAIHPDDRDRITTALETQANERYTEEYRVVRPDGDVRWVRDRSIPVEDDTGRVYRVVGVTSDITERKAHERKREKLIDRVTDAIVEVDADWRFTMVNEQAEDLYEMTESSLLGRDFWEVFTEAKETRFEDEYRRVMETREPASFVEYFSQLDGWFDIEAYPTQDGGIVFYFVEVTELRQHRLELEQANSLLSTLFETLPVGVVAEDSSRTVRRINHRLFELFDLEGSTETLVGGDSERVFETICDECLDPGGFNNRISKLVVDGEPADSVEFSLLDGRFVELSYRPIESPDGMGHMWVFHDVTELTENERDLRGFRKAVESSGHSIYFTDKRGVIEYVNPAFERMTGFTAAEAIGSTPQILKSDEHDESFFEDMWETILSGEIWRSEIINETKTGEKYVVDQTVAPIEDEDGEITHFVATNANITDQHEYEQQIERQNERLDEFAAVVSHDLRTPLTVVDGRAELAREEHDSEHLEAIQTAVDRMNRIIDDVLWLSREGRLVGSMDSVIIRDAVEDAWELVADTRDGAELHLSGDEFATFAIEADYDRLLQLLENLFRNAIEHGGEDVTVTVGPLPDGFYIEDDGSGIAENRRSDVFTPGYSTSNGGTGFGLSIVKQVASAHGWESKLTEGSQGGARFEFTDVAFTDR